MRQALKTEERVRELIKLHHEGSHSSVMPTMVTSSGPIAKIWYADWLPVRFARLF
ncbi:hypothetical protein [Paenibacillus sp. V4I7]|uniref:hypothetical protein n=1 Tax=Paenibacillus sp. V4I7 TaxID=3042307 RepID=UPI0027D7EB8E|nr:hypothetical protein [Paenibacillus sp. V4I7]